jgi:hypothetical protein
MAAASEVCHPVPHTGVFLWRVPAVAGSCRCLFFGAEPLRLLFERAAVPMARPGTAGAWVAGRRLMAIDGFVLEVADAPSNEAESGRSGSGKYTPFPQSGSWAWASAERTPSSPRRSPGSAPPPRYLETSHQRRAWDSNPRGRVNALAAHKGAEHRLPAFFCIRRGLVIAGRQCDGVPLHPCGSLRMSARVFSKCSTSGSRPATAATSPQDVSA